MKYEIGCYGDGTNGHQHTRHACANILHTFASASGRLIDDLRKEMTDDADEEIAACSWLNNHSPHNGASWGWQDGDFGLWTNEE